VELVRIIASGLFWLQKDRFFGFYYVPHPEIHIQWLLTGILMYNDLRG
jgi:hypothetical protein